MTDKKAEPLEWLLFFAGVAIGIVLTMIITIALLPKNMIVFALSGAAGAVIGGFCGQMAYKVMMRKAQ